MANGQTNISGGKTLVGTAKPSDVRMGMTYPDGKELRNGTLDLRNLKPENIKSGVTIGGVRGDYDKQLQLEFVEKNLIITNSFNYNTDSLHLITLPKGTLCVDFTGTGLYFSLNKIDYYNNEYLSFKVQLGSNAYFANVMSFFERESSNVYLYHINLIRYGCAVVMDNSNGSLFNGGPIQLHQILNNKISLSVNIHRGSRIRGHVSNPVVRITKIKTN